MLKDINVLSIENISKSYGDKMLFENLNLTITHTDKIGLIGINGTGKSTLLKIISGLETQEIGEVNFMKDISIEFLSQNPNYHNNSTILEQIFKGNSKSLNCIRDYEETLEALELNSSDNKLQKRLSQLSIQMKALDLWDYESQIKTILSKLKISNLNQKMGDLSGGLRKRVALAAVLISPCDLLVLDEPTNHMDNDTISWLESYLKGRKGALLMVTHDRYFLDRVVNKIIELDHGQLYSYSGNYTYFVEKRIERRFLENALESKRLNLYKNELSWIRRGAKARTTKQKARIQRFETLENTKYSIEDPTLTISAAHSRLGSKIIEINHIWKSFSQSPCIADFSYTMLKNDRIGIIGDNGIGKSTLLNIMTGRLLPDKGSIDIGSTVNMGYFSQESENMDENMRAIEYIKEVAEFFMTSDGLKVTASQIMETFLFSKEIQWTTISRLSGGEKRRLYLLKTLMSKPNVLILDEPTNDFDLDTLKVLESYLEDFIGAVIIVSHDRYFLDRTCKRIFSFEGNGAIIEHTGNYSEYVANRKNDTISTKEDPVKKNIKPDDLTPHSPKLTFNEKFELEQLPSQIETLEKKLSDIETEIKEHVTDFTKLQTLLEQKNNVEEALLLKMERQEHLINLN